jgi:hypothetical protein
MNLVEKVRSEVVRHELKKVGASWVRRRELLASTFSSSHPTQLELLNLADHLSDAFRLDIANDRSQNSLSGGGSIWQALICHYLNICFAGTDAVALSRRFVPDCIKAALKVSYTSSATVHADLDVMVVNIPGISKIPSSKRANPKRLAEYVCSHFPELSVVVVQAKTNWNDNAQVPMLWNFLYKLAAGGKIPQNGFSIGSGHWHLEQLKSFSYAFVTVPTNSLEKFTPTAMPVLRVANMSGGAFWGRPSRNGVILSLKEFFAKNYNVANHHFPPPSHMGTAFAKELLAPSGAIDVDAFALSAASDWTTLG